MSSSSESGVMWSRFVVLDGCGGCGGESRRRRFSGRGEEDDEKSGSGVSRRGCFGGMMAVCGVVWSDWRSRDRLRGRLWCCLASAQGSGNREPGTW